MTAKRRCLYPVCALLTFLLGCSSGAPAIDQASIQQTALADAQTLVAETYAASITDTPRPTDTQKPSPTASNTSTPQPSPIVLTGSGDNVVDIQKWAGAAIAKITHTGGGNFAIWNDAANGEHIDLLVNVIGNYQGTVPVDFLDREFTTRFEITAGGEWRIEVLPFSMARMESIPGIIQGVGDDVILVGGGAADLMKIDASQASRNFAIWTYGDDRDLAVNEIAPYTGTVAIDRTTVIIVVIATGSWTIEITAR